MIHRHKTLQIKPVWTKRNHPPTMSFRGSKASRGIFPSSKFYLVLVLCLTWWIPPLRLRCGRNDIMGGTFLRIRPLLVQCLTLPCGPHQARLGEPASPKGSSCTVLLGGIIQPHMLYSKRCLAMNHRRYIAWYHSTKQVIFETWRAANSRPYTHIDKQYHSTARVVFRTPPERHTGRSLRFR